MSYDYEVLEVLRVVDGDTVDLRIDLGFHMTAALRFRLMSVNTPERNEFGWAAATTFTQAWLIAHPRLRARTFKADSFGRWLANVYDADTDADLSQALLDAGIAVPYRF